MEAAGKKWKGLWAILDSGFAIALMIAAGPLVAVGQMFVGIAALLVGLVLLASGLNRIERLVSG